MVVASVRIITPAIAATFVVTAPITAQTVIPDAPSCGACSIEVQELFRFESTPNNPIPGPPLSVTVDAQGRFWLYFREEAPWIYDQSGKFVRQIGRRGEGPGEFKNPFYGVRITGDSIVVLDAELGRATVISPNLQIGRAVRVPYPVTVMAVGQWPSAIAAAHMYNADRIGWPLHEISFDSATASLGKSLGVNRGELRPGQYGSILQTISNPRSGAFWAADVGRYRIAHWRFDGSLQRVIERHPSWFQGESRVWMGNPTTPPPPLIRALYDDEAGNLWVFTLVARSTWQNYWPSGLQPGQELSPVLSPAPHLLRQTMIEVLDVHANRVVSRATIDAYVMHAIPGNRVVAYSESRNGDPVVRLMRFRLIRP
jgi:hypothetical protein